MDNTKLVRIPEEVWKEAKIAALMTNTPMTEWLAKAIKEKLERDKEDKR